MQNEEEGKKGMVLEGQKPSTQHTLQFGGRTITLVGTAHVSQSSVDEVGQIIASVRPQVVAVELDEGRRKSLTDKDAWRKLDVISVLRKGDGFLLLANLALASFQSSLGLDAGVKPGAEMLEAMQKADGIGARSVMVDRPIAVTLRRAWALNSLWGKCRLLAELIAMSFGAEDVSASDIEAIKGSSEMDNMLEELSRQLPAVKTALIDERDKYLAAKIWEASESGAGLSANELPSDGAGADKMATEEQPANESSAPASSERQSGAQDDAGGTRTVAIIGAGHLPGVMEHIMNIAAGEENTNVSSIDSVPRSVGGEVLAVAIPIVIIALIAAGFVLGGRNAGGKMALGWVIWNGALAAIGAVAALAHPLAILTSFLAAPLTSLCPLVGVGMASGIVQALVRRPTVADMETLTQDAASIKGWYRNRLLKVLVVFLLSSIGSSLGTFIAGAGLIKGLADVLAI